MPIGGGAVWGKDLHKVDRCGQALGREMALDLVRSGRADEATVWLAWRPGDVEPRWVEVVTSGCLGDGDGILAAGYYIGDNLLTKKENMTKATVIRAIGNSAGTTIPKAMLNRYHLSEGDTVHLVEVEDGILITPYDPAFKQAMEIYEEGSRTYRNAMRELAG